MRKCIEIVAALFSFHVVVVTGKNEGMGIWPESSRNRYALWNGTGFSTSSHEVGDINDSWNIIRGAYSPVRDEAIVIGVTNDEVVTSQIYSGGQWSDLPFSPLDNASDPNRWGFAVKYESQSGHPLLVWLEGSSGILRYAKWIGSTWILGSITTVPAVSSSANVELYLEANPKSNEMVLVMGVSTDNDFAIVWDGGSWNNYVNLENSGDGGMTAVNVAFEHQSGRAIIAYAQGTRSLKYRIWNGLAWSEELSVSAGARTRGDEEVGRVALSADPSTNRMVAAVRITSNKVWVTIWDGQDTWGSIENLGFLWRYGLDYYEHPWTDMNGATGGGSFLIETSWLTRGEFHSLAVAFEGTSQQALISYEQNNEVHYRTWSSSLGWSEGKRGPDLFGRPDSIRLYADNESNNVMMAVQKQAGKDSAFCEWNGSEWGEVTQMPVISREPKPIEVEPLLFMWKPAVADTGSPTAFPTRHPTSSPTQYPSPPPSIRPTQPPTDAPTSQPTRTPTIEPSPAPTASPTSPPTTEPPTSVPSMKPTRIPTPVPTSTTPIPTSNPTPLPTHFPTPAPSIKPTQPPTDIPTPQLTTSPTSLPTTEHPTSVPSMKPTKVETPLPTSSESVDFDTKEEGTTAAGHPCDKNNECISSTCRNGVCMATAACYPLKHKFGEPFFKHKINIVFVASGFDITTMEEWHAHVNRTYESFDDYNMLANEIEQLNIFRVDPGKVESLCFPNCFGIERLMCCDQHRAMMLAQKCFPIGSNLQTLIIHNDERYGGAGYVDTNLAAVTTHPKSPVVAAHELGHSLFDLTDEYSYGPGTEVDPNCDSTSSCDKWSDLIGNTPAGYDTVRCLPGCRNDNFYIAGKTFMSDLDSPMGAVNERFACCTYLALAKSFPSFCDAFNTTSPDDLLNYCKNNDYQGYGRASYESEPQLFISDGTVQDSSTKYVQVQSPVLVLITSRTKKPGMTVYRSKQFPLDPGMFLRSQVEGDFSSPRMAQKQGEDSVLKVAVSYRGGRKINLFYSRNKTIEVPMSLDPGENDEPLVVSEQVDSFNIVLDTMGRQVKKIRIKCIEFRKRNDLQ